MEKLDVRVIILRYYIKGVVWFFRQCFRILDHVENKLDEMGIERFEG